MSDFGIMEIKDNIIVENFHLKINKLNKLSHYVFNGYHFPKEIMEEW